MIFILELLIYIYIFINLSVLISQFVFAFKYRKKKPFKYPASFKRKQIATIIYPFYNEDEEIIIKVLESAREILRKSKDNRIFKIVVVDDGSDNSEVLKSHFDKILGRLKLAEYVYQENQGKRHAQVKGLEYVDSPYIITTDSDTILHYDDCRQLLGDLIFNPNVGAVTGDVEVRNKSTNLLTNLISQRYWMAFNIERAAQANFGSMLCCSGPFSAYRTDLFRALSTRYSNQYFMGNKCTFGDDRHMTNLILGSGYDVVYNRYAKCSTEAPENLTQYLKQQQRWNKSYFRELLWTLKFRKNVHFYSMYQLITHPIVLILMLLSYANIFAIAMSGDISIAFKFLTTIILMAFVRAVYGYFFTKDLTYWYMPIYAFLHFFLLLPLKLQSVFSINDGAWGTRGNSKRNIWRTVILSSVIVFLLLITLGLIINSF